MITAAAVGPRPMPVYIDRVTFHWSPARMDQLERAARDGLRVSITRRGTEYVVVARRLEILPRGERLIGYLSMAGREIPFPLSEIEWFEVLG